MDNILNLVAELLGPYIVWPIFLGILPDAPDEIMALFQYTSEPPFHTFGQTNFSYGVQVRTRSTAPERAYAHAQMAQDILNGHNDETTSVTQTTSILDIGQDQKNRYEYTVNFTVFER